MDANKFVKLFIMLTGVLLITGFIKAYLVSFGLPSLVVGTITIPVVEAFIIALLFLYVFKKWVKVEA